jgi:hypothetical protein
MAPKKKDSGTKKPRLNKKKMDIRRFGYQGEGVVVDGLTIIPWSDIQHVTNDKETERVLQMERALQNTKQTDSTRENAIVKQILDLTPSVLRFYPKDPFTEGREPGSGPVKLYIPEKVGEISQQLHFDNDNDNDNELQLMDIKEDEILGTGKGVKRRHQKMKTRKASRKTKSKRRKTSVRRR